MAFCTYECSTVAVRLGRDSTMAYLFGILLERWPELDLDILGVSYAISDHCNIILATDEDMINMISHLLHVKAYRVDITIKRKVCLDIISVDANKGQRLFHDNQRMDEASSSLNHHCLNDERQLLSQRWGSVLTDVGQKFEGGASEFRVQLCKYAIEHGFQYHFVKNDMVRITAVCSMACCPWRVHASVESNGHAFYIKKFNKEHSCGGGICTLKHPRMNAKLVSSIVSGQLRDKPLLRPIEIQKDFKANYGLDISYFHAWKGKEKAIKEIHGDDALFFDLLRSYCALVRSSNPGSHVVLDYDHASSRFQRFFIAFGACIEGFQYCRPLIFLDGTFLKGKYKGVLLSATGKNGNQGIFPLAFAIVDAENEVNWTWFLQRLSEILDQQRTIVFMLDRNKGLLEAVPRIFPQSFHGFCLQHLKQNLREKISVYRGNKYRDRLVNLFSECAHAPTYAMFLEKMAQLRADGGEQVANFLSSLPYENWANAYFKGCRYGKMYSNVAESFISWILDARHLPITQMLDHIRIQIMKMMADRLIAAKKWTTFLCPEMDKKLKDIMKIGKLWTVSRSSEHIFEVNSSPRALVVIEKLACDCCKWKINGFPCAHAAIAIQKNGHSVYDYCDPYFRAAYFVEAYSKPILPIPGFEKQVALVENTIIRPPMTRRPPGRPKKKRVSSIGQDKKLIRCTRCKKIGNHNRRSCKAVIDE